jgi:hypothetical protein
LPFPEKRAKWHSDCSHILANAALVQEDAVDAPWNRVFLEADANRMLSDCGDHIMIALVGKSHATEVFNRLNAWYVRPLKAWSKKSTKRGISANTVAKLDYAWRRGVRELKSVDIDVNEKGRISPRSPAIVEGAVEFTKLGELLGLGQCLRTLSYSPTATRANAAQNIERRLLRSILIRHYHLCRQVMREDVDPAECLITIDDVKRLTMNCVLEFSFRHGSVYVAPYEVNDALFDYVAHRYNFDAEDISLRYCTHSTFPAWRLQKAPWPTERRIG